MSRVTGAFRFLNRTTELALLEQAWGSGRAELLVLYGRRRVGKTELLARFAEGRRAILLEATDVRAEDQLRDLGAAYVDGLGLGPLVAEVSDWETALGLFADAARGERTLVVLDEFQYLVRQAPELGSVLSRWWRTVGSRLDLVFVLAGSDLSFFSHEVLDATAPLHGRRTVEYRLLPFAPRDVSLFVPGWGAEDRVRAYAVWGGVPYYLSLLDPDASLEENLYATILRPGAPLQREADYLIRIESRLRDVALYGSILRGLASGRTTASALAGHLGGADAGNLARQLGRLEEVGLVRQVRPLLRARKTAVRYEIGDSFLRFWFRFVAPVTSRLTTHERAHRYLSSTLLPALDEFVSAPAFEEVCRADFLERVDAATVGRWWGPVAERFDGRMRSVDREADGVALDDRGALIALASCKWARSPVDVSELNKLRRIAATLAPGRAVPIVVYARRGVDERLETERRTAPGEIVVVSPEELYPPA